MGLRDVHDVPRIGERDVCGGVEPHRSVDACGERRGVHGAENGGDLTGQYFADCMAGRLRKVEGAILRIPG